MNITKACPDCGRPLVERTNRATGEPFLGCSQYPACKHSEPLPEAVRLRRAARACGDVRGGGKLRVAHLSITSN